MFQDIYPHKFDNQFRNIHPEKGDKVLCYRDGKALLKGISTPADAEAAGVGGTPAEVGAAGHGVDGAWIPVLGELREDGVDVDEEALSYGFSVDGEKFFVSRVAFGDCNGVCGEVDGALPKGYQLVETRAARDTMDHLLAFQLIMGLHLFDWYSKTKFCGKCGTPMELGTKERAMICPKCGNVVYPRISPVIIVGVTHGDEILLTKYADRDYSRYALIAGFMEFGETPEDTVRREVYEEAGLRVKEITYYKSQPWPYPDSLLLGFYAEVDEAAPEGLTPVLRDGELGEATWFKRSDVPKAESDFALTSELMENFRNS